MVEIFSKTDEQTIPAADNSTILEATLKAGIRHTHVCGGQARCSTCRVYILEGLDNCLPRNTKEQRVARQLGFPEHIRLACQTRITGNIAIKRAVVDDLDIEIILKQIGDESGAQFGKEIEVAVLFADIENYTQFAETFPAYDVVHVLNRYYRTMNTIIEDNHGIISDVAGDGILALFGVLKERPNPVLDALDAARAMNQALISFNRYLDQMYDRTFGIRTGINYGKAIIGSFDTGKMSKISAIGDSVNLASRIEAANKGFGTRLLLSESAFKKIKDPSLAYRAHQTSLKGKSGSHILYEIEL